MINDIFHLEGIANDQAIFREPFSQTEALKRFSRSIQEQNPNSERYLLYTVLHVSG